jgi:hypothetical protein
VLAALELPVLSQVPWVGLVEKNGSGKRKSALKRSDEDANETVEV